MKIALEIEEEKARLLYRALVRYDGPSLCEDWPKEEQWELTEALDTLRQALYSQEIR